MLTNPLLPIYLSTKLSMIFCMEICASIVALSCEGGGGLALSSGVESLEILVVEIRFLVVVPQPLPRPFQ